ncbi:MAG: EamA family transporter [Gemmatimonadetes bacterium]|nr:EamA family transporter [Gemmatimonadota bacterium]
MSGGHFDGAQAATQRGGIAGHGESEFAAELGLLAMVAIWGVNFSAIKVALRELHPLAFNAVRFPMAAAMLWVALRQRGGVPALEPADRTRIMALGILGNVVYQLFFIYGMAMTTAGSASILLASTPIWTALLSNVLGHERLRPVVWIGVFATAAGMTLVVASGGVAGGSLPGNLFMVGASLSWSVYTVGARQLVHRYGSLPVTAWTLWIGAAGLVLVGAIPVARTPLSDVTPLAWGATAYAGALGIGIAYMLWYVGVRRLGNTRTAVHSNLVPVIALGVAWIWLGESPSPVQLLGAAVIIGGVTLTGLVGRGRRS